MAQRPYCTHRLPRCTPTDPAWRLGFELYASPFDVRYLKNNSCRQRNDELGVSHARLPVSHMATFSERSGQHVGLWLYYMRGCSDLTIDVGRTLLARNRCDAAVLIEQRRSQCTYAEAVKRVARSLRTLSYGYNAREYAAILRQARAVFGRGGAAEVSAVAAAGRAGAADGSAGAADGRTGVSDRSYEWLVRECAAGVYDDGASDCTVALVDASTNYTRVHAWPRRAWALAMAAAHPALDEVSAAALRELVGTKWEIDTVQLVEQPQSNAITWAVEIWDVRLLADESVRGRPRVPPGVPDVSSRLARRHVSRLGSDEPGSCPPWSHVRHGSDFCWACTNSSMAISCDNAASKCTRPQMARLERAHQRQPSLLHAPLVR